MYQGGLLVLVGGMRELERLGSVAIGWGEGLRPLGVGYSPVSALVLADSQAVH